MARRRYYRRSVRTYPKKKWATNIIQNSVTTSGVAEICKNSSQTSNPTPTIIKCGNFKIQGDVMYSVVSTSSNPRPVNITFFIIFCPEGVAANDSLIGNHPEWIIGWKTLDVGSVGSSTQNISSTSFSFSSRLKRNLNSGDRVVAILQSLDTSMTAQAVFTCQFWTCTN